MPADPQRYEAATARLLARPPEHVTADRERMVTLAELLGRPDRAYPAIAVSGGDDARSVAIMVSALLASLGLTAGCYLASHLQDIRERIRIAGEPIDAERLADRLDELDAILAEVDARDREPLDVAGALAAVTFAHFADAPVDVAVVDGSGAGPAGPMSLARAEVAVLAAVEAAEGPGAAAASERAGLVEEGGAVITGPLDDEKAAAVAEACQRRQARLVAVTESAAIGQRRLAVGGQHLGLRGQTADFDDVYLPLHGRRQATNAGIALAAVEGLLGFAGGIDAEVIREGFAAVRVPGRIEVVRREGASTVVLDVVGGPQRASELAGALQEEFAFRHRVLVADARGAEGPEAADDLAPLLEIASHVVLLAPAESVTDPRGLARAVEEAGASVETADDVPTALELASGLAKEEDGVIVAGSPPTVGAARQALGLGVA